ncbi:MAG: HEAT repeat domain-containing protein [Planctomycetes bacterium]|nr:HEAT repeat domain-containing protein [Planctomycetota bacterium]
MLRHRLLTTSAFLGSSVALSLFISMGLASRAEAHGGQYRGPGGQVPATGRTPNDPDPPHPGGEPHPHPGITPSPIPTTPGGHPAGGTTGAPHTAGTTGGHRPKGSRTGEGFESWEFWWAYNRDRFLDLRGRRARGTVTSGSADVFFTRGGSPAVDRPSAKLVRDQLVPALRAALSDGFFDARASAAIALGKVGDARALPDLIRALADDNKQVSESAALGIGLLGSLEATPVLLHLLDDDVDGRKLVLRAEVPYRTRAFAAIGLGLLRDESAVQALLAAIDRHDPVKDVRVCATIALGILRSPSAVNRLIAIVGDSTIDDIIRSHAVTSLGKIGSAEALPAVRAAVADSSVHVSRSAVIALGLLAGTDDERTQASLRDVAEKATDVQMRAWACIALGETGGKDARRVLLSTLAKEQSGLRAYGALGAAIYGIKFHDASIAPVIRESLANERDQGLRGAFCVALGILEDRAAEKDLTGILQDEKDPALRGFAALSLGMIGARGAQPAIEATLADSRVASPDLQRSAAMALGLLGDPAAVPLLTKLLRESQSEFVICSSALALGTIGDWHAIDPLIAVVKDVHGTPDLSRANALSALGTIADDAPLPKLHVVADHTNYRAQVESLGELLSIL